MWGWTQRALDRLLRASACSAWSLFLLAERRIGDDALLPLRLFRNRTFGVGARLNLVIGMGMFGGLAALPLYLQIVKGTTPTEAGLLMLPLVLGIMTGSVAVRPDHRPHRPVQDLPGRRHGAAGARHAAAQPDRRRHLAGRDRRCTC